MLTINLKYKVGSKEEKKDTQFPYSQISKRLECCSEYSAVLEALGTMIAAETTYLFPIGGG